MSFTPYRLGNAIRQTALNAAVEIPDQFSKESIATLLDGAFFPDLCLNTDAADDIAEFAVKSAEQKLRVLSRGNGIIVTEINPIDGAEIWIKSLSKWLKVKGNTLSKLFKVKDTDGIYQDANRILLAPKLAAAALAAEAAMVFVLMSEMRSISEVLSDKDTWAKVIDLIGQSLTQKQPESNLEKAVALIAHIHSNTGGKPPGGSGPR